VSASFSLGVGTQVLYRARPYQVVGRTARTVTLRGLDDAAIHDVAVTHLVASEGFEIIGAPAASGIPSGLLLDFVPEAELERAKWRWHHLQEALSGYRSGNPEDALEGEPRPEYEVAVSRRKRLEVKATEMEAERPGENVSVRSLYRWAADVSEFGLLGLCDKRYHKLHRPFASVAPQVIETLDEVVAEHADLSTVTIEKIRHEVRRRMQAKWKSSVRMPGRTTFYELFKARTRQTSAVGEAATRRSATRRPKPSLAPMRAMRSGEILMVDSTTADVLCLDRRTGRVVRPEITVAIDGFCRSFRALTVTPKSTRGVDAGFLLYDAAVPTACAPEWLDDMEWNYAGIPRAIVIEIGRQHLRGRAPAALPFGTSSMVVTDHGKIWLSRPFWAACEELGTSVLLAPPYRPHHKGVVERFFRTLNTHLLQELPGYTGRSATMRGKRVEETAVLFLDEMRDLILEWAIRVYQNAPHDGCRLPHAPQIPVTPNALFEYSVAETGLINVVPRADQLLKILPHVWKKINHYGVNIDRLRYHEPILDEWLHRPSPYGNGKFPFHVDPRDLSRVWFQDPRDHSWHELKRLGARHPDMPFDDAGLAWTKRLMLEAGFDVRDPEALNDEVDALIERRLGGTARDAREEGLISRAIAASERSREALDVLDDIPDLFQQAKQAAKLVAIPGLAEEAPPATNDGPPLIEDVEDGMPEDDWDDWTDNLEPMGNLD
jgi:hypothetical protein